MIDTVYIEEAVEKHPRTLEICQRFESANKIICERYTQVFNPKAQNFRLQKQAPALILAEKFKNFALAAPPGYGIGAERNFYFSHMLNCPFDCRYCFLQGMYQSANYVVFVNYEDFGMEIRRIAEQSPDDEIHFFSGYDCDSLAFEPITGFARFFLPVFRSLPNAWIELRTKSTQISSLLQTEPMPNCIIAFSFTPEIMSNALEHKVPSVNKRLSAMQRLQEAGWTVGLRFDPVLFGKDCYEQYATLYDTIFGKLATDCIHSVSLGGFRLPEKFYKKIRKLYPQEKLFAAPMQAAKGMISYPDPIEDELIGYCSELLLKYIPKEKFFPCTV